MKTLLTIVGLVFLVLAGMSAIASYLMFGETVEMLSALFATFLLFGIGISAIRVKPALG